MHFFKTVSCFMCLCIFVQYIYAQEGQSAVSPFGNLLFNTTQFIKTDSGIIMNHYYKDACKSYSVKTQFIPYYIQVELVATTKESAKAKLFSIHGNISYDFIYRSRIDTPISQQNFQQHTERINLDVVVKEKYPLKVAFISRQSNSPFFRNFLDMNLNFDRYAYTKNIRQDLINKLSGKLAANPDLKSATEELNKKLSKYNELKNWLGSGATLQKIIEEKEKKYRQEILNNGRSGTNDPGGISRSNADPTELVNRRSGFKDSIEAKGHIQQFFENRDKFKFNSSNLTKGLPQTDLYRDRKDSVHTALKDSVTHKPGFIELFDQKQKELVALADSIKRLQRKTDSIRFTAQKHIEEIKQKIYKATNANDLKKIATENGIQQDQKEKLEKILAGIKILGIGRSMLNYTELTAQNITVTGVNIEFNPSYYAAFASGKIDYRFRDFYNRNSSRNNDQYLVLGRLGIGDKDSKALILSVFQGRKGTSQFGLSDSVTNHVNVMGYSLEALLKKNEYTSISAEFAKSTKPVTGSLQANKQTGVLFKFSDYSNMGINIKAQTIIPETNTKVSGFYRRTGKSFQSFSLFSYNSDQTAWLIRADQQFFKTRMTVTGMLRQNDFTNPFTDKTFKTSTTFKSVLVSVRIPKYPSFSVGYYPGTQLYFIDKEKIRENAYYILNGSMVYSYYYNRIRMNTSVLYNRYFNQATDSGFVLNTGINYYASQTIFLNKMQVKAGYAYTRQTELSFYTVESSADYAIKSFLKIGAGIKYNKIASGNLYIGQQALLSADCKKLGGLTIQYERSFLPTLNHTLVPIEIGRVSWYKIF